MIIMVIILTINNGENYDGAYNDYDGENHDGDYNDFNGKIIMVIILIIMVRIIMMVINDYGENHYDDNDDLHIIYDLYMLQLTCNDHYNDNGNDDHDHDDDGDIEGA